MKQTLCRGAAALIVIAAVLFAGSARQSVPVPEPTPTPELSAPEPTPTPTPVPTPEPTPTPTPEPQPEYFTISLVGDCTLSSGPINDNYDFGYRKTVGEDYAYPFTETLALLEDDDCTIANLECVLSESEKYSDKNFVFRAPPEFANVLTEGSVELVTLGNNHVRDYGEEGYADTKAALDAVGVAYAGRDEWTVYETESGLKIGFYAVSFGYDAQIRAGIEAVREAGADFVIAAIHWGDEGSYKVNGLQRQQGHTAVDAGADFVYGSHPHTLQPVEEYEGKYIYYSMGNWTFGGNTNPRDKDTVLVRLTVMRDLDGSISLVSVENIPCSSSGESNRNNYQPVVLAEDDERYARVLSKLDGSFTGADLTIGYEYGFSEY